MKGGCTIFIPPATKLGGILESPCPSVRLSSAFGFPAHNCFPFTLIIMKLHMQTPHETRMCPIDFEVQRSRSQYINYWKWFPAHNYFLFTPIIMKLHMQTPHESRMCPIDFEVKRSRSQIVPAGVFFPLGQPRSSLFRLGCFEDLRCFNNLQSYRDFEVSRYQISEKFFFDLVTLTLTFYLLLK